jgi:hypothetical protein
LFFDFVAVVAPTAPTAIFDAGKFAKYPFSPAAMFDLARGPWVGVVVGFGHDVPVVVVEDDVAVVVSFGNVNVAAMLGPDTHGYFFAVVIDVGSDTVVGGGVCGCHRFAPLAPS